MITSYLKTASILSILVILSGCYGQEKNGVNGADGETPVRYVLCGANESNCIVSARLANIEDCENHKKWSEMLCDSTTNPEQMTCEKEKGEKIVFSYCTF